MKFWYLCAHLDAINPGTDQEAPWSQSSSKKSSIGLNLSSQQICRSLPGNWRWSSSWWSFGWTLGACWLSSGVSCSSIGILESRLFICSDGLAYLSLHSGSTWSLPLDILKSSKIATYRSQGSFEGPGPQIIKKSSPNFIKCLLDLALPGILWLSRSLKGRSSSKT